MFTDYVFPQVILLVFIVILISVGFYFTQLIIINAFKKTKEEKQIEIDDLNFHFKQIEAQKNIERELIQKIEKIRQNIDSLTKTYEDGVFLKKNLKIWQITRSLFQDLNWWKKKKTFSLNDEQVDFYLEDIVNIFKELGIELIDPQVGSRFDSSIMKATGTLQGLQSQNNTVAEIDKIGFKLKLENRYRVLQEAEVKVYK
jgi:molecular chaperone GrpE (heat shock protein)